MVLQAGGYGVQIPALVGAQVASCVCERGPDVRDFGARVERFSFINVADLEAHFCGGGTPPGAV